MTETCTTRNRNTENNITHLGGIFLEKVDTRKLYDIASASVGYVSIWVNGDIGAGHGSSFLYKQLIDTEKNSSTLFFMTNAHVTEILDDYITKAIFGKCSREDIETSSIVFGTRIKDHIYPIKYVLVPKIFSEKQYAFQGDFAVFSVEIEGVEEFDFFSIDPRKNAQLYPGKKLFAFGYPTDAALSMRQGIVSNIGKTIPNTIQHDVLTNGGDSGGATVLETGEVVGITVGGQEEHYGRIVAGLNFSVEMRHILETISDSSQMIKNDVSAVIESARTQVKYLFNSTL